MGYRFRLQLYDADATRNSDADVATGMTAWFLFLPGAQNLTIDAGLVRY